MSAKFVSTGIHVVGTPKTTVSLIASTSRRGRIFHFGVGIYDTPADLQIKWILQRFTADGTAGATVAPSAIDPGEGAALLTSGQAYSAEGTFTSTAIHFQKGINIRAPFEFFCRPGAEFVIPATAANGYGLRAQHGSSTLATTGVLSHEE